MSGNALEGLRVVEFTNGAVGTFAAKRLADFGAEVIRVESKQYIDPMRLMWGPDNFHRCPPFTSAGLGRKSIAVNMKTQKGVEIVKGLVKVSDVFLENYGVGAVEGWGLDYPNLAKINPQIIMFRAPGLGLGGPRTKHKTQGPLLAALGGLYYLWHHPDESRPIGSRIIHPDFYCANQAAMVILAALDYRSRTGKGQLIDMSQSEVVASLLGPTYLDYTVNGRVQDAVGNRCSYAAPHGCYQCFGEDKWCAIAVLTDEEWRSFCDAIGNPPWTKEARFATMLDRVKNTEALDTFVSEWTITRSPFEVMEILQKAGVMAGVALNAEELYRDPQINHRGYIVEVDHRAAGRRAYSGIPMILSETPGEVRPCPMMGEHTEEVLHDLLGMSNNEIQELAEEGVLA